MHREQRSAFKERALNVSDSYKIQMSPQLHKLIAFYVPLAILTFGLSLFRFNLNLKYMTKMLSMLGINILPDAYYQFGC